jgi:hypothetical protein
LIRGHFAIVSIGPIVHAEKNSLDEIHDTCLTQQTAVCPSANSIEVGDMPVIKLCKGGIGSNTGFAPHCHVDKQVLI